MDKPSIGRNAVGLERVILPSNEYTSHPLSFAGDEPMVGRRVELLASAPERGEWAVIGEITEATFSPFDPKHLVAFEMRLDQPLPTASELHFRYARAWSKRYALRASSGYACAWWSCMTFVPTAPRVFLNPDALLRAVGDEGARTAGYAPTLERGAVEGMVAPISGLGGGGVALKRSDLIDFKAMVVKGMSLKDEMAHKQARADLVLGAAGLRRNIGDAPN